MYGLSGASGRHCCLYCHISSSDLKTPPSQRGHSQQRSLDSLQTDHQGYLAAGRDIRKAKYHNNVIAPTFLDIPLEKVSIPGLHMSLGIFKRLWDLLENGMKELDLKVACHK